MSTSRKSLQLAHDLIKAAKWLETHPASASAVSNTLELHGFCDCEQQILQAAKECDAEVTDIEPGYLMTGIDLGNVHIRLYWYANVKTENPTRGGKL